MSHLRVAGNSVAAGIVCREARARQEGLKCKAVALGLNLVVAADAEVRHLGEEGLQKEGSLG